MFAGRYTQTAKHTDKLIAILRYPYRGAVININTILQFLQSKLRSCIV